VRLNAVCNLSRRVWAVAGAACTLLIAFGSPPLQAQQADLKFEVASVKRAAPGIDGYGIFQGPDDVRAVNAPIGTILIFAYGLSRYDSPVGLPDWAQRDTFDIVAKAGRRVTIGEKRLMTRALLADRFGVLAHIEERQLDVLALIRRDALAPLPRGFESVKCPTQLSEVSERVPPCVTRSAAGEWTTDGLTMAQLADRLGVRLGKRVVDQTGLKGPYKFSLKFSVPDSTGARDGADISTALTEQLGLRLIPAKAPVAVLVVDRIHPPTPN
jgi:uncharacterized protein (TIGR03435 family)